MSRPSLGVVWRSRRQIHPPLAYYLRTQVDKIRHHAVPNFRLSSVTAGPSFELLSNPSIRLAMGSTALDSLPDSLATLSTARFDKLLAADSIKYAESTPENVPLSEHLSIEFRIISSLSRKPLLPSSSASHTAPHPAPPIQDQNKKAPFNPFLDPREEEIVLREVGARHRLLMNKYCTTRPMLLLTTKDFRSQSEDLHREDFEACWATLKVLDGERPYMAIYNCGPESGNSQRHKHMQCFPRFESAKLHPECKEARRSEPISLAFAQRGY